jgi:hypothetical protein
VPGASVATSASAASPLELSPSWVAPRAATRDRHQAAPSTPDRGPRDCPGPC